MIKGDVWERSLNLPFRHWIRWNLILNLKDEGKTWKETFYITLWWIWTWRNDEVFNDKKMSLDRKYNVVYCYSHEIIAGARQRIATGGGTKPGLEWIGWTPPLPGWTKLYTDRSFLEDSDRAGAGGLLRDESGS